MSTIKSFDPEFLETRDLHRLLLSAVAPRPIAFASTIDAKGNEIGRASCRERV